jgi:hypothetical protein
VVFVCCSYPSQISRWLQSEYRREWFRAKDTITQWRLGWLGFILISVNLWAQSKESVLFSKSSFKVPVTFFVYFTKRDMEPYAVVYAYNPSNSRG